MAILYVGAEAMEVEPFAASLTGVRKLKWPIDYAFEGVWEGRRVMLAANGAGPRLAAQAVEIAIRAVTGAEGVSAMPPKGPRLPDYICVPGPTTGPQLREAVVKWLRDHPSAERQSASQATMRALNDTYLCPGEQRRPQ